MAVYREGVGGMTLTDDWLASHATVTCFYGTKMTERACMNYQEANPDGCRDCERYRGAGRRRRAGVFPIGRKFYYEEMVNMNGVEDLFQEKALKKEKVKLVIFLPLDQKERLEEIENERRYKISETIEAMVADGLKKYDTLAAKK